MRRRDASLPSPQPTTSASNPAPIAANGFQSMPPTRRLSTLPANGKTVKAAANQSTRRVASPNHAPVSASNA
ncbi:MAG: hypothetical protein ACK58T_05785, partial [Phycisphaerae bacterium]